MTDNNNQTASKTPTHIAYHVRDREGSKGFWTRIGSAWAHADGNDYIDRKAGFVPLTYHTKRLAFAAGLRPHCTDIIRFSHGTSSSRKVYRSSFIPGLHDVCMVFERA